MVRVPTLSVDVGYPLQHLEGNVSHSRLRKKLGTMMQHLIQVLLHILKHHEHCVVLAHHLTQLDYVRVPHLHQGL